MRIALLLGNAALFIITLVLLFQRRRNHPRSTISSHSDVSSGEPKRALLVTAHPDDESMFFLPLIHTLLYNPAEVEGWHLTLLCLSTGDFHGLGAIRTKELHQCLAYLGVSSTQVHVLHDPQLLDGMATEWDPQYIASIVTRYVQDERIDAVFTFDEGGVSGHVNHIAVSKGVAQALQALETSCESTGQETEAHQKHGRVQGWALETVPFLRKYLGCFDALFSIVGDTTHACVYLMQPWWNYRAMALHASQFVWYRRLFVIFSRYTFLNTFKPITRQTVDEKKKKTA